MSRVLPCALLAWAPVRAVGQSDAGRSVVYVLAPGSRFDVRTGKAGLLGFFGHDHLIRAGAFSGRIVYLPAAPSGSRLEITVPTESLEVLTPPDTAEVRQVTAAMRTEVLDVARFPQITFASRRVTPITGGFRVVGDLTMHGVTREVTVDVRAEVGADTLRASGSFAVKQTDFGIRPYRGGPGGTVRVADRVSFDIAAVAVAERASGP